MMFTPLASASALVRCILCLALFLTTASALDKVNIVAQVRAAGKAADPGGGRAETQKRFLEVEIVNRTREDLSGLTVKWTLFGSDLKDDDTVIAESGNTKVDLAPGRAEKFESQEVTFHYSREGFKKTKGKKKRPGKLKRIPASGTRYAGWAVRVYQGRNLIGEAYSLPELKEAL